MDYPEGAVAFLNGIDKDTDGKKVVNIIEVLTHRPVFLYLLGDAVNMLRPAGDIDFQTGLLEPG